MLCRPNDLARARLGIAVSKKRCKKAAARNRIRRIIRESFRHAQAGIGGLDVIVMNQPAAADAGNRELFDSLARHWQRCSRARPTSEAPADG